VAPSATVQQAIDKKAVAMALDAYELFRQHLARCVAYHSEIGMPRRVDEKLALRAIASADLGTALTAKYHNQLHAIAALTDQVARLANDYRDKVRAAIHLTA
jgi:hypothetical protein